MEFLIKFSLKLESFLKFSVWKLTKFLLPKLYPLCEILSIINHHI